MQKDALLVKQTLAGEHEAFHRLIISYQSDIYAFILSWVGNPDDAKELVQDAFLEAYRDLGSLRQHERFYFWLRQIAKYHCQNWLKRKREFVPLSDDIVAKTPSADETIILRETLAKVMQAIDELPETEKRLMKERYLDESSYDELQAKHGLSYKALNMRLLRAKQKVRARVEKLLAGIGIFSWHDALKKMLSGGIESMKITAKVKIATIGVAAVLVLGGIIIWHTHQSAQETQNSALNQTGQQTNSSLSPKISIVKAVANKKVNKPIDKQKEDVNDSQNIAQTDLLKDPIGQETKKSESKINGTVDPKEKSVTSGLTSAERTEIEAKFPVLEGEIKTEMIRINSIGNKIQEYIQSGQNRTDDSIDKWCAEADKEVQKAWMDLFNTKIGLYTSYGIMLEGKNFKYPLSKGGSLYELAQLLPFNVFPRNFDDNNFKIIDNNQ
jgi:RNA polymerase sigma factor (sigma-70 family)